MDKLNQREILLQAYHHKRTGYVPSAFNVDICWPSVLNEGRPKFGYGKYVDDWGVGWEYIEGQPGAINDESAQPVLTDVTQWHKQVKFPDPDAYDWVSAAEKDTAKWDRDNNISNVIIICGIWERFYMLCGFQEALCNLLIEPEATYDCLKAIAEHRLKYIDYIAKYYKPDKIQVHDDYGSEKALLFSADTWRELIKPHLKRLVDACHSYGILYEHHSCGYIVPLIKDFIELGIDGWNTVQYTNDPPKLAKQYHDRFTLVGGLNDRLFVDPKATDEDKKANIIQTIQLAAEYGSWVVRPFPGMEEKWIRFLRESIDSFNNAVCV